ncbi:MAG: hypothetical protein JXA73_17180 [Acidobacteria bacterium]|nr:hypothetical protein [Acidobacteriota bacterium]
MPTKEIVNQLRLIVKQIPGMQSINGLRHKILRLQDLSDLIKMKKIVVFKMRSGPGSDIALAQAVGQEVLKEWMDLYGIVRIKRATAIEMGARREASLLYAPQAFLKIPASHREYLEGIERETRRLIRLSEKKGYEFKSFAWNDRLDDIFVINTSKAFRQSEPMRGWYREPAKPRDHSEEELRHRKYYGAFKDGKLYAYFHIYIYEDLAIGKHFIGHAEHLKHGIMNGLISFTVRECINNLQVKWLNYGEWQRKGSLNAFKQHSGFQGYAILLEFEDEKELLEYSKQKVRTIWRL